MLDYFVRRKLESLTRLPSIPYIFTEVLRALDDDKMKASSIAGIIERDQSLTARVLTIANSPFYGFARRISTVELAIVLIGTNSIKEVVISMILQRFFGRIRKDIFDIQNFWNYSVFCGACARTLARRLGYKLAGEAFVAGVMHDIGILILSEHFQQQFAQMRTIQTALNYSFVEAEKTILNSTHCGIGAWLAEKWRLPEKLVNAIKYHHTPAVSADEGENEDSELNEMKKKQLDPDEQILTAIVAMAEWFAEDLGFKGWAMEYTPSPLYKPKEIVDRLSSHDIFLPDGALSMLKNEILEEYNRCSSLYELSDSSY